MSFPTTAMEFYRELEVNNDRAWWLANKARYDEQVRAPIEQVLALLEDEFGAAKIFRPHRDVRFSADKSPYKTHQGAYVSTGPACGFYVEVNARDAIAGGGFYRADSAALARFRAAIADDESGRQLERLVDDLAAAGWQLGGDTVATAPRGFSKDHPRIELLRHKSLHVAQDLRAEGIDDIAAEIRSVWQEAGQLVDWLSARLRD